MPLFPVIRTLIVDRYDLYPASLTEPFKVRFRAGATVVAGVNGSGKSTLLHMLLRLLTGPYDLPSSRTEGELGQVRATLRSLSADEKAYFANRVSDEAKDSSATLEVDFGNSKWSITRSLQDLHLIACDIDGEDIRGTAQSRGDFERQYQERLAQTVGVESFFDIVIILRFITFFLEDRRALIWDKTAQRQIWRVLLLAPEKAKKFAEAQQSLIAIDSAYRNTHVQLKRIRDRQSEILQQSANLSDVEALLRAKRASLIAEQKKRLELADERKIAFKNREDARLKRMLAAEEYENCLRGLEKIKIETLGHWFKPSQQSLRYIYAQLLADKTCLVCETNPAPNFDTLTERIESGACPICGSNHGRDKHVVSLSQARRRQIKQLEGDADIAEKQVKAAEKSLFLAGEKLGPLLEEFDNATKTIVSLEDEIIRLTQKLPPEKRMRVATDSQVDLLQAQLDIDEAERKKAAKKFSKLLKEVTEKVAAVQNSVGIAFSKYIDVFVKEQASLVYRTVSQSVAQGSDSFEFPVLLLSMTGGSISGQTIRQDPYSVSQSQAEFVDLAFRMALMEIAGDGQSASMVVDAPEASLDFLFAARAGQQLSRFGKANRRNRSIVSSYLPSHHFVSAFLQNVANVAERSGRIVNLIEDAAPNAALKADKIKYSKFLRKIILNQVRHDA